MRAQSIFVTLLLICFIPLHTHEYSLEDWNSLLSDGYYDLDSAVEVSAYHCLMVIPVDNPPNAPEASHAPQPCPEPFYSSTPASSYPSQSNSHTRRPLESPLDRLESSGIHIRGGPSHAYNHIQSCGHARFDEALVPSVDDCRHMNNE